MGSSAKAITQLCPGDDRVNIEVIYGEDGRAVELKAQSLSNLSPPSEIKDDSFGRRTVGCKLKGPSGSGQILRGSKPSGMKGWTRREERVARKGKTPVTRMRVSTQEEKTIVSRSNLFPPSVDRRQGHQSSSEPLLPRSSSPFSKVRHLEVDFGTGSQMERGIRESPLFRYLLSRKFKSCSREETSTSRGGADSRNSHLKEDIEGFTGRVGYDPRGSSVTVSPSIPRIRGKGIIFEGNCKISGAENMELR